MDATVMGCILLLTLFIVGLSWIGIQQNKRIKTLEYWVRRFDEVLDPEGTGDVYIKNENYRKSGGTGCSLPFVVSKERE
jgi:hypothetical protein